MYYWGMPLFSNKIHLALNAALYVAYHGRQDYPISGASIAAYYHLNSRALEPVLQVLAQNDILQSVRGQSGGYYIGEPEKISIKKILDCFIAGLFPENRAFPEFSAILKTALSDSRNSFMLALSNITLKDLCRRCEKEGFPKLSAQILDFAI